MDMHALVSSIKLNFRLDFRGNGSRTVSVIRLFDYISLGCGLCSVQGR